jgi:L-alanine-DL-glutamate epimerase-like enolase superfamily enzyme
LWGGDRGGGMPVTAPTALTLDIAAESWPLARAFTISRGAKSEARVVVASISDGTHRGRGECVPYARYGESLDGVMADIRSVEAGLLASPTREILAALLPPGAARNALDCALWDLEARRTGVSVADRIGAAPRAVETCFTISLGAPERMAADARAAAHMPLLKLKLGGDGDVERLAAVRAAVPSARLVADANEAWRPEQLQPFMAAAAAAGVELIEQPLPAGADDALAGIERIVPVCADESAHGASSLAALVGRYDAVNLKLDKTGGLTGAIEARAEARRLGLKIMVGCMVATSLAMAPAALLAEEAEWVDLDGPLLLARDREDGLRYESGRLAPPDRALWG